MKFFIAVIATFVMLVSLVERGETQKTAKQCFFASISGLSLIMIAEAVARLLG